MKKLVFVAVVALLIALPAVLMPKAKADANAITFNAIAYNASTMKKLSEESNGQVSLYWFNGLGELMGSTQADWFGDGGGNISFEATPLAGAAQVWVIGVSGNADRALWFRGPDLPRAGITTTMTLGNALFH